MAIALSPFQKQAVVSDNKINLALKEALKNPLKNADIIADLTQFRYDCDILIKVSENDSITAVCYYKDLPYNNINILPGNIDDIKLLVAQLTQKYPNLLNQPVFGLYDSAVAGIIENFYQITQKTPEIKMTLSNTDIPEMLFDASKYKLEQLTTQDVVQISYLFSLIPSMAWTPKALSFGPYYGAFYNNNLVCIAGVHFAVNGVTEVGNIVTHFKHRRQNLAYCCTKAVIEKVKETCSNIFLCVFASETSAIKLYEKMGFEKIEDLILVQYYLK